MKTSNFQNYHQPILYPSFLFIFIFKTFFTFSGEDKRTKSRPSGPSQNEETTKNEDANSDSHAFDEQVKANDDEKDDDIKDDPNEQLNIEKE